MDQVQDHQEERWRDLRRARLLEAARRVFARLGYEAATVDDIAFEAGIGKPTIYRYFEGKEALFEAVFAQTLDDLEARLDAALAVPGPMAERLSRLVGEMVPTFRDHIVPMRDLSGGETWKRRVFRPRRARIAARLAGVIAEGQAAGEARAVDPAVAARFLIGLVWSGTNSDLAGDAEITAAIVDFAFRGLAPEGRP
ncbi:TetR/AcrR family transcriptional regulator [Labrys wisconsinensis]|uniref:AcrR family transcriptional regulator n=1 Tax=Labrys wisconsinensis TaxID=425677 RepID=A0ABU0JAY7_9HYPH|nr:TetR/AcrR family transcriptional regulator [Labrys wisconsinensis]MDQ0470342.1 AcrR family transcriptional regulator [Labrys wisconsinensis]